MTGCGPRPYSAGDPIWTSVVRATSSAPVATSRWSGSVSSVAGFGVAYVDLPRIGKVRPFLGAGLGVARNRMGAMTYTFPNLSAKATTTTPGGNSSNLAYLLSAGLSVPVGDRLDLDLAYRYTDLARCKPAAVRPMWCAPAAPAALQLVAPGPICVAMA